MEINCPNCGAQVPAEKINIQRMVAVCSNCSHVFSFDIPRAKVKRRKAKQPKYLLLREADTLNMEFRTNFRLDKEEAFLSGTIMSVVFTFLTMLTFGGFVASDVPFPIPILFGSLALIAYYVVALRVYNKTHIDVEDDVITVSRGPIPSPMEQPYEINLSGVTGFRSEETLISKREGFDTPRYIVRAVMEDGSTKTVVNDVTDDYAHFIAQRLTEYLESAYDVAQLSDLEGAVDQPFISIEDTDHDESEYPSNGYVNSTKKSSTHGNS